MLLNLNLEKYVFMYAMLWFLFILVTIQLSLKVFIGLKSFILEKAICLENFIFARNGFVVFTYLYYK